MENLKIPPQDVDAENAILGSMLVSSDAVISAIEKLDPIDFYRNDNRAIFEAIRNLYSKSEPIDLITVKNELVSMGMIEKIGGVTYLYNLPEKAPSTNNIDRYIDIVKNRSTARQLIQTAGEIAEMGYDQTADVQDVMNMAEKKIFDISQSKSKKTYEELTKILTANVNRLEMLYNQTNPIAGIPTGFVDLDKKTAGLHNSNYILIAARPAMGKTAFALNIATNVAKRANVPVAIFSLEMSKEELVSRIMCSEAMIDAGKIRVGNLDDEDWAKVVESLGQLSDVPMYIDDSSDISVNEIRTKCRKLKMEKNIGLVVVDYLQLVKASSKKGYNREQEIAEISRSFKILAKELDIPVIVLSQLSRAAESRPDHRPMLSDLRESGSIEQDADIVMFIFREDYYNKESQKKDIAEITIAKHRAGSTGTVELLWFGKYTKFVNLDRMYQDDQNSNIEG